MNEVTVFNFEGRSLRTQIDDKGNPWWSASDVCSVLAIKNVSDAVSRLDEDERCDIVSTDVVGRDATIIAVNESGLYTLILGSRKAEAKKFKKWVTSEVLPAIRKTGSYSFAINEKAKVYPTAEPVFKALASVAQMFGLEKNQALLYANKATRRETGVDFQSILQIEMKSPEQERAFTPTELGQRIGLSAKKFNLELERAGLQQKRNDVWCATESGKPFSVLLDAGKKHSDGTPIQQLKWLETVMSQIDDTRATA